MTPRSGTGGRAAGKRHPSWHRYLTVAAALGLAGCFHGLEPERPHWDTGLPSALAQQTQQAARGAVSGPSEAEDTAADSRCRTVAKSEDVAALHHAYESAKCAALLAQHALRDVTERQFDRESCTQRRAICFGDDPLPGVDFAKHAGRRCNAAAASWEACQVPSTQADQCIALLREALEKITTRYAADARLCDAAGLKAMQAEAALRQDAGRPERARLKFKKTYDFSPLAALGQVEVRLDADAQDTCRAFFACHGVHPGDAMAFLPPPLPPASVTRQ